MLRFFRFSLIFLSFLAALINLYPATAMAADQVLLTATVEPLANSAELKIDGLPDSSKLLSQDSEIKITISYKHRLPEAYPMEIIGEWEQGLIEGTGSNYIDILDYVVGSATAADDGTKPVIDPAKRRISWNIPSVAPSDKFREVSFSLKVRPDIPTDKKITVNIKANGKIVNSTLSGKSITYSIKKALVPSPTPITKPVQVIPFRFNFVRIDETADTYLIVGFETSRQSTYTLFYGENPALLTKKITGLTYQTLHTAKIPDLLSKRQYYFRVVARDRSGNEISSDLFTATTASGKDTLKLDRDDFTVHWGKYFLISRLIDTVVIPRNKPVTITSKIGDSTNISKIKAVFVDEKVLGINTFTPAANIGETPLIEILPGVFSGEIQAPSRKGVYSILFEITDVNGGLYKKTPPYEFYVADPLRVVDKKTGRPIENAEVKITKYQESTKLFAPLGNSFAILTKTDQNGELDVVLPTGIYNIEVKSPRHKPTDAKIELGISDLNYPVLELESDNSFQAQVSYFKEEFINFSNYAGLTIKDFFSSPNHKDIFLIISAGFLLFLLLLNFHLRKKAGMIDRILSFSIVDILEFITVLSSLLFIIFLGFEATGMLTIFTAFILALGITYTRRAFFRRKL